MGSLWIRVQRRARRRHECGGFDGAQQNRVDATGQEVAHVVALLGDVDIAVEDDEFDVGMAAGLRLERRLARDVANRGRDAGSVRRQYQKTVAPMHNRFVEPQVRWADVVLRQPLRQGEVERIGGTIHASVYPAVRPVVLRSKSLREAE